MRVVVSSRNPVKVNAVKKALLLLRILAVHKRHGGQLGSALPALLRANAERCGKQGEGYT